VLSTQTGNSDHIVSSLDPGSPAEASGVLVADRLIEVNGINVETRPHQYVAEMVKKSGKYIDLLVVDSLTDQYFRENKMPMSSGRPYVQNKVCPISQAKGKNNRETSRKYIT